MKENIKQEIKVVLMVLKGVMKSNNVSFAIIVDENDYNRSEMAFIDNVALENGETKGITVSIDEMND